MAKPTRVYWDACAWIAYINQEKSIPLSDGTVENRFSMCRTILNEAESGQIEVVTSAFTLAEVCKSQGVKASPLDYLPAFFDKSYILIVPVDFAIGLQAQSLQVSGLVNLKPPDAIHLASAQRAFVNEFHTFDDRIVNLDGRIADSKGNAIKICKPTEGTPIGPLFGP